MKRGWFLQSIVGLATCGSLVPTPAVVAAETAAATTRPAPSPVGDVVLSESGGLLGMVANADGTPVAGAQVAIRREGKQVLNAVTNKQGQFTVTGLSSGVYEVTAGQGTGTFRVWTAHQAPPSAKQGVLIVANPAALRGQTPLANIVTSELAILTAVVGAAIAIPIVVHNSRRSRQSGS